MQAPVRRLLPAAVDLNITKPRNIMNQMDKEFEEIENMNIIACPSVTSTNRKKKRNSTNTTKNIPPLPSVINSTGTENFVIYDDSTDKRTEKPVETPNALKPRKNNIRNTAKSSIPISTRMTRSKRT